MPMPEPRDADLNGPPADLEGAAWLFEQLAVEAGRPAERPAIRRAFDEAGVACPSEPGDGGWRWLLEAGHSLGLRCQLVDCTLAQGVEAARDGAAVLMRGDQEWGALIGARRGRIEWLQRTGRPPRAWRPLGDLPGLAGVDGLSSPIRCLMVEPGLAGGDWCRLPASERTPLRRLLGLLRPEWPDIWIIVVFAIVTGVLALAAPMAVETLVNTVAFGRLLQPVVVLALMLLAFLSLSAAIRGLQTYVVEIIQRRLFARVAADLAYRLPRVEWRQLDGLHGREPANRFFDIVTVQKVCAQLLLDGVSLVIGAIVGMGVLAFYHPWLLGFDIVLLAMIALVVLVLGRGAVYTSVKESKAKYHMAAWLEELLGCRQAFRLGGAGDFALERADRLVHDYLNARRAHFRVLLRQIVFALGLQAVASTVLLGLGGWLVVTGQLTLGQLVAAELIVTVIVSSFAKLGKHMESYYDVLASVDKLGGLFDLQIERQDGGLVLAGPGPLEVTAEGLRYDVYEHGGLRSPVSFSLAAGERLVVQGPEGAGKSLLLDLLFGARHPTTGHLRIAGRDPRQVRPDALRRRVALARDMEILAGTIGENVHFERPDVGADDVREALSLVGLGETVLGLPEGVETELVEGGAPLSSTQARLLVLARAIVARPGLLLIDGLLDALPDDMARRVGEWLASPERPWTLVLVTGRESLVGLATQTLWIGEPSSDGSLHKS